MCLFSLLFSFFNHRKLLVIFMFAFEKGNARMEPVKLLHYT